MHQLCHGPLTDIVALKTFPWWVCDEGMSIHNESKWGRGNWLDCRLATGSPLRTSHDSHPTAASIYCVAALCLWAGVGGDGRRVRESSEAWESHKGSLAGSHLDTLYREKLMKKSGGQWAIISGSKRLLSLILGEPPALLPILVLLDL